MISTTEPSSGDVCSQEGSLPRPGKPAENRRGLSILKTSLLHIHTPTENACNHLCFSFKTKQSKSVCLVYSVFKYVFLYRGSYGGSTTFDCGSFARTTGKIQETLLKYFAAFPYQAYQASLSMFLIPSGKLTSMKEEAILTFVQWSESVLGNEGHCYFFVKSLPASVSKNY